MAQPILKFTLFPVSALPLANTEDMRFVVFPVTIVNVTVRMDQPSSAIGLVIFPVTFVDASI